MLLGLVIGIALGPVLAKWLTDYYAHRERYRLTSPVSICIDSRAPCSPVGSLSAGMLLDVDSKGFAQIVVRVEPGIGPKDIEPAVSEDAPRLVLQGEAP